MKTTSKIRVMFISHTYVVGVNQGKLEAIAATGKAEVALLTPKQWKAAEWYKEFQVEKPSDQIKFYPTPIVFSGRGGAYFYSPLAALKAIVDFRPDIIQVEEEVFSLSAFEIAIFARLLKKPVVFFGWENMDRQLSAFRRWIRQFVLNTAKYIIAGNCEGGELVKKWGYQGAIEVMPQMGVDTKLFAPAPEAIKNPEYRIGFVGRLSYQKGIDTLIAACHLLQKQGYNFRIILCGSGKDEPIFRKEAEKYGLEEFITWRGGVRHDEVPEEIRNFDVLVLPSRTVSTWKEQFGHVLIEAMATAIPVIGSSCGEIPNVIGRSDLIFTEGNAQELAAILRRLISEPNWRLEMAKYSLDRIHKFYSHERIAERLIDLWNSVLKQQSLLLSPNSLPSSSEAALQIPNK